MAILTKEQKDKYLAEGAQACPICGSADISGQSFESEATEVWQNVDCRTCGEGWRDVYALSFVETDDELNGVTK
jgi:hypothetical protein